MNQLQPAIGLPQGQYLPEVILSFSADPNYSVKGTAEKYMRFRPVTDSLSNEQAKKRRELLKGHLREMNKKYSKLYGPIATPIIPYADLAPHQQVPFGEGILDSVYGVLFPREKIMYFWVENAKVAGFDLWIQKGKGKNGNAYFVTY